jgi:hypothetical protein
MNEHLFRYCERGIDPSFWAEPINALSNAAFFVAAAIAYSHWRDRPPYERSSFALFLIVMVFVIGVGSFLFHTFANRWSALADIIPIGMFMALYLGYALIRFAGARWAGTGLGLGAFVVAFELAGAVKCHNGRVGLLADLPPDAQAMCMNGSAEYLPALTAMFALGLWLAARRHPASRYLLGAGAVFLASLTFRSLDYVLCDTFKIAGKQIGVHFLWHFLNAATLCLLLLAAVRHGKNWRRGGPSPLALGGGGSSRSHVSHSRSGSPPRMARGKVKPEIIPPRPGTAKRPGTINRPGATSGRWR